MESNITILSFNTLRKGDYINIDGRPCKIINYTISSPGKHGSAKANITAIDIFTDKKKPFVCGTTDNLEVPIVVKKNYTVLNIDSDGFLSLMSSNAETRNDIRIKDQDYIQDLLNKFNEATEQDKNLVVTIISAMSEDKVYSDQFEY